jgi:bile acid:Na+ symporter, BASS family
MSIMLFLEQTSSVVMLVFVLSSMLTLGFGLTVRQIMEPLRSVRLVTLSLLANFVVMPVVALALAYGLWLAEPLRVGLVLLGAAAGAPFLPKLAQIARGNVAFSVGLMVLLILVSIGYLPLLLPLLLPGVTVDTVQIAKSLVLLMLVPLAGGLAVNAMWPKFAARVRPWLEIVSNASVVLVFVLLLIVNVQGELSLFGTRGVLAGILFVAAGYGAGWLLGGPGSDTRTVLGQGTSQRNIAAAMIVGKSFSDPLVVVMVVVVATLGALMLLPYSHRLGRQAQ